MNKLRHPFGIIATHCVSFFVTLTTFAKFIACIFSTDSRLIIYPGDVHFGLLFNTHVGSNESHCGSEIDPRGVHNAMAAVWATHQINTRKESSSNLNIGVYLYDTCSSSEAAERQSVRLIAHLDDIQAKVCRNNKEPPLFGNYSKLFMFFNAK
ncbi:metabotropic glutamate receptor 8-like protein [Dinothrombium tinctorium]|uniref:Metabotropic glutamate receptor 8-like protein n=1 Tax=Dinothrombium tinctorium TaxID=1965070 RepID=A0A443QZE4_9ACAR|nr:metabotropic glutamate receptor 8-like protein [Dinothrombium tinctorium]